MNKFILIGVTSAALATARAQDAPSTPVASPDIEDLRQQVQALTETVNPVLVDWNKNVAARLAPFPGFTSGMIETNGHQQYRRWSEMVSYHPCADASWRRVTGGVFELGEEFYARSGCIYEESAHYRGIVGNEGRNH